MESKKNLLIDEGVWREIRKAAIDCGKTIGEFITMLFIRWREAKQADADRHATDPPGGAKDWKHRG